MHKSQVFLYLLGAFVTGVAIASVFSLSNLVLYWILIIGTAIVVFSVYEKTFPQTVKGIRQRKMGTLIGFLMIASALGIYRFNYVDQSATALAQFADVMIGGKNLKFDFTGYVADDPAINTNSQRFSLRVKRIDASGKSVYVNEKILVISNVYPRYKTGDYLTINGALETPVNFNDFDYQTYLKRDGIRYISSFPQIERPKTDPQLAWYEKTGVSIYRKIFELKNVFQSSVNRSISEPYASYMNGILIGSRSSMPQDIKDAFATTSTSHILAISGYNITVIGEALLMFLVFFMKRRQAFWISVIVIIMFTILTGASASVVRASVMGLLLLFANGYGRLYDVKNSIVLAGALMIALNPFVLVFDVGFQLSFVAVLGLIYVSPILGRLLGKWGSLESVKEILVMTMSAQLSVLPLLVYYFKNFSLVSLPANLIVLPFVPYAMLFGFFAGLAGIIWPLSGQVIGYVAWAISNFQIGVIQYFASIKSLSVSMSINSFTLCGIYLIMIALLWWEHKREEERHIDKKDRMA